MLSAWCLRRSERWRGMTLLWLPLELTETQILKASSWASVLGERSLPAGRQGTDPLLSLPADSRVWWIKNKNQELRVKSSLVKGWFHGLDHGTRVDQQNYREVSWTSPRNRL